MQALRDLWLVDPSHLEATLEVLQVGAKSFTSAEQIRSAMAMAEEYEQAADAKPYELDPHGTAQIRLGGMLLKEVPCLFWLMGVDATSTTRARRQIQHALADDEVKAIHLVVDSPGGTVEGISALADEVFQARGKKPITAHASDLACSAAYWVASQADRFTAGPTAVIGSIGVYTVIRDLSRAAEMEGVKVHLVTSGPYKGAGAPGTVVTDKHLEASQGLINTMTELFVAAVARGLGMSVEQVKALATGAVWVGAQALEAGLIHAVEDDVSRPPNPDAPAAPAEDEEGMEKQNASAASAAELDKIRAEISALTEKVSAADDRAQKAEAKAALAEAHLQKMQGSQVTAILDRFQGDAFDPAQRPMLEGIASKAFAGDPAGLEAYLQSLVAMGPKNKRNPSGGIPAANGPTVEPELAKMAARYGLSAEDIAAADKVVSLPLVRKPKKEVV